MVDVSTEAQLFAFAIFFIPGYLSLNIGSFLVAGVRLRLPWAEKVILSFVWSSLIYFAVFVATNRALTFESVVSELSPVLLVELLVASLIFGVVAGFVYFLGFRSLASMPKAGKRLGKKLGLGWIVNRLEGFYFESASDRFLRSLYEARENNDIIIETKWDRVFRGKPGSISVQPTLDLVISQRVSISGDNKLKVDQPLYELDKNGQWKNLKEFSVMIPQGNIRSVHGIKRGEGIP